MNISQLDEIKKLSNAIIDKAEKYLSVVYYINNYSSILYAMMTGRTLKDKLWYDTSKSTKDMRSRSEEIHENLKRIYDIVQKNPKSLVFFKEEFNKGNYNSKML